MKTILYVFSGTGNSLSVARALAKDLGNTDVAAIAALPAGTVSTDADRVGIVFPVYVFGLPMIVAEFCRRLDVKADAYVFGVATCGGMPGAALRQMQRLLAERGRALAFGAVVVMPGNYTPLYGAPSEARQSKLFAKAAVRLAAIAAAVREGKPGRIETSNPLVNWLFSGWMYERSMPHLREADAKFRWTDRCNRCGVCRQVCPVSNIELQDGHPVWQHRCEQCMACLQWCPQQAIEFGKSTVGRRRYHHPDFSARDLMLRGIP